MLELAVVLLFLLVVFCGGQRFPFVRVAWSLGGLGFFMVLDSMSLARLDAQGAVGVRCLAGVLSPSPV